MRKQVLIPVMMSGDTTAPTCTITCAQTSPTGTSPLNFTFTFSETVTGFAIGDITAAITGGTVTKSNFAGSGTTYTCDLSPSVNGTVTVDVGAGVCTDAAGNGNAAATQFSIAYSSLLNSLISYWKLDETSNGSAPVQRNDSHSTNHLTDNNTSPSATGKISNAADFTPANTEFLSHTSNASLQAGDIDFTFALWVYLDTNTVCQFISKDAIGARDYFLDYAAGGGNSVRFCVLDGTTNFVLASVNGCTTGAWHFIVGWHNAAANTVNIQIDNGTPASVDTAGLVPGTTASDFRIGARVYTGFEGYMDGKADEVGFWKRVLTADERTALYATGSGLTYPF